MFADVKSNVKDFVEKQKRDREHRRALQDRTKAALIIQVFDLIICLSHYMLNRSSGVGLYHDAM